MIGLAGAVGRRDQPGAGHQAEPQRDETDVDGAAAGHDVAVDVGPRHLREDRLEASRVPRGREDLADSHVGRPAHARGAVAPLLPCRPVDDGDSVLALAATERTPDALGGAGAAGVDGELCVAALDQVAGGRSGETATSTDDALVVGRDGDDDRQRRGHRLAVLAARPHQVGAQRDAVVHGDRQVGGGDGAGVLRWSRRPCRCCGPGRRLGGRGSGQRSDQARSQEDGDDDADQRGARCVARRPVCAMLAATSRAVSQVVTPSYSWVRRRAGPPRSAACPPAGGDGVDGGRR